MNEVPAKILTLGFIRTLVRSNQYITSNIIRET